MDSKERREYKRDWYIRNSERVRANRRERYRKNHKAELKQRRDYYYKHQEQEQEYARRYINEHYKDPNWRRYILDRQNKWYDNLDPKKKEKLLSTNRKRWHDNKEKYGKQKREQYYPKYSLNLKTKVFTLCGKGKIQCLDCGITDLNILTLDHTNGRKPEEKGKDKKKYVGKALYIKVIRSNNSEGYETVCFNCNWKRHLDRLKKSKEDK